ncbi:hypothetical protein [Saccharopolyspora sp. NPDC049426]|uniref:hypothetical protein n=1 Tax=Saccharopolyspora sp. NPDC049426 TaxID=3155652 RepID=UPI00343950B0
MTEAENAGLDALLLDVAQRFEEQGFADEARHLRRSLAYLRDAWSGADAFIDPNLALVIIRDSAQNLLEVMDRSDRINAERVCLTAVILWGHTPESVTSDLLGGVARVTLLVRTQSGISHHVLLRCVSHLARWALWITTKDWPGSERRERSNS